MLWHQHVAYDPEAKFGPSVVQRSNKLEPKAVGGENLDAAVDAPGEVM